MQSIPSLVAVMGPMVDPHGMLLRVTNVWRGTPQESAIEVMSAAPLELVAYLWFPFSFSAGPRLMRGAWRGSWRSW